MDSGDLASNELAQHMTMLLADRDRERIIEIDDALKRMDDLSYGMCEACGLEIAEQRLQAMPFTRHCRDCQQDHEREAKTRYRGNDIEQGRF
jgi:DnaK suppressor protein